MELRAIIGPEQLAVLAAAVEDYEWEPTIDWSHFKGSQAEWRGYCWILKDGTVVACCYADHYKTASAVSGVDSECFSREDYALHVSDWIYHTHRPTPEQVETLLYLTKYERIKQAMEYQEWTVENYCDSRNGKGWKI